MIANVPTQNYHLISFLLQHTLRKTWFLKQIFFWFFMQMLFSFKPIFKVWWIVLVLFVAIRQVKLIVDLEFQLYRTRTTAYTTWIKQTVFSHTNNWLESWALKLLKPLKSALIISYWKLSCKVTFQLVIFLKALRLA